MHEDNGAITDGLFITSAGILFILLILSLTSNLLLHFILVLLPAYLVFLAACHFKRFLGALVLSAAFLLCASLFLLLAILSFAYSFITLYFVLTDILFLIMTFFSALQLARMHRSKNKLVERLIYLGINAVLYMIAVLSLLMPTPSAKTTMDGVVISIFAMLGIIALFSLVCMISVKFLRLKMVIKDNMLNLALSMLAWGVVGLFFYWLLDLNVPCGCSCEYPLFLGHYLFTTVMLATGSAIITTRMAKNNMEGDKNE